MAKEEFWRLKENQLNLKRETKTEKKNKPYEVVNLKSENEVSLKETIKEMGEKTWICLKKKKFNWSQELREENKDEKRKKCWKYR